MMFSTTPTWRISAVAAVLALGLAGCSDDDDNAGPTAPSGGTAVTAENAGEVQTALMTTFAGVAAKGPGTHPGASSGQVVIAITTGKPVQVPSARFTMDFDNYSDDGALFVDGDLTYETGNAIVVTGDLNLSGTYEGSVGLDLSVSGTTATGTISVNGTTVDIGSPGAGGDTGGGDAGVGENTVIYGDATVDMVTITCNPNTFGIPRFAFDAKNTDNSISANVALRGSSPEDGSSFTLDPELGGGSSRVKLYYDSKNWTNELNADNTVAFVSDGTTQRVHGSDIVVVNDRDASETMVVTFNIACE